MKLLMLCEQKQTQNPKKIMFKEFLCRKTKQNTEMSDEQHSDSEFYYPEEQETVGILTKLKQAVWKVSFGCIDFRNNKLLINAI